MVGLVLGAISFVVGLTLRLALLALKVVGFALRLAWKAIVFVFSGIGCLIAKAYKWVRERKEVGLC